MDRAAAKDFAAVDLDAITAAGDRTVRRRRVVTGVAGVAAAAVVGVTAAVLAGGGDDRAGFSDVPFRTDVPMWTEGSVLHTPHATYDLGLDVLTFVRTSEGIVFTSPIDDESLGVYSFTGDGEPEQVGETGDPHLRSDPDEPYAGWLDQSGEGPEAVVVDQGTVEEVWSAPARLEYSFPIVAIDDGSVYLADADEHPTRVVDLGSGEETKLADADPYFIDVEGDLRAYLLEGPGGEDLGIEVRRPSAPTVEIENEDGGLGVFSPGGQWISGAAEHVSVYDTTTGKPVADFTDIEGYGYGWADAGTLLVIAEAPRDNDVLQLLSCEVPAGDCRALSTFDDLTQLFAIGDSEVLWGLLRGEDESASAESSTGAAE